MYPLPKIAVFLFCLISTSLLSNQFDLSSPKGLGFQDSIQASDHYFHLGKKCYEEKEFQEAKRLLQMAQKTASLSDKPRILNIQGNIYWYLGAYDSALSCYTESLRYSQMSGDRKHEATAFNNIGFIYSEYEDFEKTRDFYQKALNIREEDGDEPGMAMSYNSLGRVYLSLNQEEQSIQYHQRALDLFRKLESPKGESNALNCIANVYFIQLKYEEALDYYQRSLEKRKEIKDAILISESLKNISKTLIQQKKYKHALEIVNDGIQNAKVTQSEKRLQQFYHQKYLIYQALGSDKEALEYYILATQVREKLLSVESKNRIEELNLAYETEKREKRIQFLNNQNELAQHQSKTRLYLLWIVLVLFIMALFIFLLVYRQNKLKSELSIEQSKQRLLRSQMSPHFIYNALSAIQNFILDKDKLDAVAYISEFSSLMRMVLEGSRKELVTLEEDMKLAHNYLKLQELRFDHRFSYEFKYDKNLDLDMIYLPPMLSQPFIENAIEHGMRDLNDKKGCIILAYKMENNHLVLSINDNGIGIDVSLKKQGHQSLATQITKERISSIHKSLKLKIQMLTKSDKDLGTEIIFSIPQKQQL